MFYECCKWTQNGEYPNTESSKYGCHEPRASLHTLKESTLEREWLGVKKE